MRRFILAAILVAISGAAIAQSMGLGMGIPERLGGKVTPQTGSILVDTGSQLLVNTGVVLLIKAP